MTNKEKLILDIKFFFINNEIEGAVNLIELNRNFETSTGSEEGSIDIIEVRESDFTYTPSGHDDEIDDYYNVLSESDLEEIIDALGDYKADLEKTKKRCQ